MSRRLRTALAVGAIALATVAAIGAALALARAGRDSERVMTAAGTMESILLRQAAVVDSAGGAGSDRFRRLGRQFDVALAEALSETRAGSPERSLLVAEAELADRWRAAVLPALDGQGGPDPESRGALLDAFAQRAAELRGRLLRTQTNAERRARRIALGLALAIVALALVATGLSAVRAWRRHAAHAAETSRRLVDDRRYRAEQEEFTRALQGARTEREAQRMLKRQLERALPDGEATVLNRNNSDNRLEAVTALPADSPLALAVPDAEPEDCLAVRFGQPQNREAGSFPLLGCELCGALSGSVTCVPSLVGREVIGSVLIETPDPLDDAGHRRLSEAVSQAAPVLSSMRNLRLAETRASTDALTGLPNRRSAEATLKRMLAQAGRSTTQAAVALFDLDHFKRVNDVYGHEKGDQLLAAVGDVASSTIRASDFVARFGGEEFLLVLPDTGLDGGLVACDGLRRAIADLRLPGLGQGPSASFGVAIFPADGAEPEALLRGADRALYAAKSSGRNCVRALSALDDSQDRRAPESPVAAD